MIWTRWSLVQIIISDRPQLRSSGRRSSQPSTRATASGHGARHGDEDAACLWQPARPTPGTGPFRELLCDLITSVTLFRQSARIGSSGHDLLDRGRAGLATAQATLALSIPIPAAKQRCFLFLSGFFVRPGSNQRESLCGAGMCLCLLCRAEIPLCPALRVAHAATAEKESYLRACVTLCSISGNRSKYVQTENYKNKKAAFRAVLFLLWDVLISFSQS